MTAPSEVVAMLPVLVEVDAVTVPSEVDAMLPVLVEVEALSDAQGPGEAMADHHDEVDADGFEGLGVGGVSFFVAQLTP